MDEYNTKLTFKNTIRLFLGCGSNRYKADIGLSYRKTDEYHEYDLKRLRIEPQTITGISAGPRTVVEFFTDANLLKNKRTIVNESWTNERMQNFGCVEGQQISSITIRSFRIWSYEYYVATNGIRYCKDSGECENDEYCMCPGGEIQKNWCPKSGKRCMHMSRYMQSNPKRAHFDDIINVHCLLDKLKNYKYRSFNELHQMASDCLTRQDGQVLEGFGANTGAKFPMIHYVVIIFIFLALVILFSALSKH